MIVSERTKLLLQDIENRLDPETEEDYLAQWDTFLSGNYTGKYFTPTRRITSGPSREFAPVLINDAIEDYDAMLYSQLLGVSGAMESGYGALGVRSNYGTGIITSLFGAEVFMMAPELNTLPTTRNVSNEVIDRILETGVPPLTNGLGRRTLEMGEIYREVFRNYPKIERYVKPYHPDFQGPLDLAELLWGCEMFYAMYDEPEKVHALLRIISDTYTAFMNRWLELFPMDAVNTHWSLRHRGGILLRDDSAMNLSAEFYREYALPYDRELLDRYNGGVVHFCGRGDHYMPDLSQVSSLTGINMSQPELNDMETIFRCTLDRGIPLLGFSRSWAEKLSEREYHGLMNA